MTPPPPAPDHVSPGDGLFSGASPDEIAELMFEHMSNHVLARIGIGTTDVDDRPTLTLTPSEVTTDPEGWVDFGVLGVFFDMASSNAFDPPRGGVHADISVTRLRPTTGPMVASARPLREGKRTAIVEIDLHDATTRALVATSTQEIVLRQMPIGEDANGSAEIMETMRSRFRAVLDGTVRLTSSLPETLGVERSGAQWTMALAPERTNGMGALHGGCGITLVEVAATEATTALIGPCRTLQSTVRFLAPGRIGPFRARPEVDVVTPGVAVARVFVTDPGQEDRLVMMADTQLVVC